MAITINGSGTITGATTMASATSFSADVTLGGSGVDILNNSGNRVLGQTGSIIQVVQTVKTDTFSTTSATLVDVTGLSVSITPSSSSSKIMVFFDVGNSANVSSANLTALLRNGSVIYGGDASSGRPNGLAQTYYAGDYALTRTTGCFLDSPATTSAVTYKIQMAASAGAATVYLNRTTSDRASTTYDIRTASSITVMEIAQ